MKWRCTKCIFGGDLWAAQDGTHVKGWVGTCGPEALQGFVAQLWQVAVATHRSSISLKFRALTSRQTAFHN